MVDNEPLEARKADDIEKDTSRIPLTCSSSSCSTVTQGQTARLSVTDVRDDGQCDAAVDNEDDRLAAAPSADASDTLRQIVIDGSNIAMRFELLQCFIRPLDRCRKVLITDELAFFFLSFFSV